MQRVAGPTTRLAIPLVLAAALILTVSLPGCGSNPADVSSVSEGEAMKLGELEYNVQVSRFLNPADAEDKAYLAGEPPPPKGKLYLGVFLEVTNESDTQQQLPTAFRVVDTVGQRFKPLPSRNAFALPIGGNVPANGSLPEAESTAANGPIQGAMVLFLISEGAIQDRPLILDVPSATGSGGTVELDI